MIQSRINLHNTLAIWILFYGISAGSPIVPPVDDAEELVQRALKAELDGRLSERNELLAKAIKLDPSYRPARWQSGQVFLNVDQADKKWIPIEEAEAKAAGSSLLAEYDKMRRIKFDDAAGNEVLAKWCQRRGLSERAKIHWARVLRHQPNHKTARSRLNLKEYQGGWYTREQVAEIKKLQVRKNQLWRKWQPRLSTWRQIFLRNDDEAQENVKQELKQIVDADLIGLIETQLSPYDQELAMAVIDSLAAVKEQTATESLVRHAILSKWPSVRKAATSELNKRSLHGYVPILIDAMMSPYEFQSWSVRSPLDSDQVLALNYSVEQKGKHADQLRQGRVNIIGATDDGPAEEIEAELRQRIEELNKSTERFNKPIVEVLRSTTGQDFDSDPNQWNDWWNDFNEYQVPEFKPVFTSFVRTDSFIATQPYSCFPAGILVSTETGRKPIEDIQVGDAVLSQNPTTGELTYKTVLETTVRQSDSIVEVTMNDEFLLVTRGHPMWVNGRQWQMAKQLRRGDWLHSVHGPVEVTAIRDVARSTKVYNLVIADFNTYFVGKSRVLVHDNTLYTPPGVSLPGE